MPKSSKRRNRNYKKTRRNKKQVKRFRKSQKGDEDYDKVKCCVCERKVAIQDTLIPVKCLKINGLKAHRICSECWWAPDTGFATEGLSHKCPGCVKNLPLPIQKSVPIESVIDLTEEDDD